MAKNFKKISNKIRVTFLKLYYEGYKYHLGGSASCLDLLTILFFGGFINFNDKKRSKFILSKGHALGVLYAILLNQNLIKKRKFDIFNKKGLLGGQLDTRVFKDFVDWNTGSLGHSIGVSTGFAISNPNKKVWTIVGDAEMEEGSIWEGLFYISEKKINNIIIIVDRNKISASTKIEKKEIFDKKILDNLKINVFRINGHNHKSIFNTYLKAKKSKLSSIIVADTIKGKGLDIAENNLKYSHQRLSDKIVDRLIKKYE